MSWVCFVIDALLLVVEIRGAEKKYIFINNESNLLVIDASLLGVEIRETKQRYFEWQLQYPNASKVRKNRTMADFSNYTVFNITVANKSNYNENKNHGKSTRKFAKRGYE